MATDRALTEWRKAPMAASTIEGPRGDVTETHTGPRTVNAEEPRHRGPAKSLRVAIWQEEQEERRGMRRRERTRGTTSTRQERGQLTLRRRITPRGQMANDRGSGAAALDQAASEVAAKLPQRRAGPARGEEKQKPIPVSVSCPATVAFTRDQTGSVTRAAEVATGRELVCPHCCARPANDHQFRFRLRSPPFPSFNSVDLGFVTTWSALSPSRSTRRRCSPTGNAPSRREPPVQPREPGARRHQTRSRPSGPPRLADSAREADAPREGERGVENR